MTDPLSHTAHSDAPLSAAKKPDVLAVNAELQPQDGDALVGRSVTIDRPREELYKFWRDFSNLPRFMPSIDRVEVLSATRSHWVLKAPAGTTVEWTSDITHDGPGRMIAWRSAEGASVRNSGVVEFMDSPDNRGTVVKVTLVYDPPAGTVGKLIAKLLHQDPKVQARQELRRFKQLMETGEISTAQPPAAAPRA